MKSTKQTSRPKEAAVLGKQRSYAEIIEFLDANWQTNANDSSLTCVKKLDQALGNIAQNTPAIWVTGTNGKSLTISYTTQLLKEEGMRVGAFSAPHILTYNERITFDAESIANKSFTDVANTVINTAESLGLTPNSYEILLMMALLHFKEIKADVVLIEADRAPYFATRILTPKITAITRATFDKTEENNEFVTQMLSAIDTNTHVISGDQSKASLEFMQKLTLEKGAHWAMPIRKLAALPYPLEQLHGRCAALAERIASIWMNEFIDQESVVISDTLLCKQKGQRGRPTLEAKRQAELNPKKTVDDFWKNAQSSLPGRFQHLEKEKPSVLLDNAYNLDALENLLLGVRLLHYERPIKGLTIILGCNNNDINMPQLSKALRYFFKKTSGQIIICPITPLPGQKTGDSWVAEQVANDIKSMKMKARAAATFKEAFETAQKTVDDRYGLIVVTGSAGIVSEYWNYKGIKKI
jgi:dihydrofolate synthase/folylpolyglutamate synthase